MHIIKIVSGGQSGAKRGEWKAAIYCSLACGVVTVIALAADIRL
jgi:hypothetical protein